MPTSGIMEETSPVRLKKSALCPWHPSESLLMPLKNIGKSDCGCHQSAGFLLLELVSVC
jgi:hypothetical protein